MMEARSHCSDSGSRHSSKVRSAEVEAPRRTFELPVLDVDDVPDLDRGCAAGVPSGVPGEPVHRFGRDRLHPPVVPDRQRGAGGGEAHLHRDVEGSFTYCCCHGWSALPDFSCSSHPGGSLPSSTSRSGKSPDCPAMSLRLLSLSTRIPRRPPARRSSEPDPRLHGGPGEPVLIGKCSKSSSSADRPSGPARRAYRTCNALTRSGAMPQPWNIYSHRHAGKRRKHVELHLMPDHADLSMDGGYDSPRTPLSWPGRRRAGLHASGDSLSCAEGSTCPQWGTTRTGHRRGGRPRVLPACQPGTA
jgi:hypothetical protein